MTDIYLGVLIGLAIGSIGGAILTWNFLSMRLEDKYSNLMGEIVDDVFMNWDEGLQ